MRDGEKEGSMGGGGREIIYLSLHCYHQNDSCIKMGSDESHFKVSLIVRDKVTRQCPQTTTFEEKGEPKRYRTKVLPLTRPTALPLRRCVASANLISTHTASIVFRYLPPNSARFSYATEGVFFISAQLSSDAVSAVRKVLVLI